MRTVIVFVLGVFLFTPFSAQSQYNTWSNPDTQPSQQTPSAPTSNALQDFTDKLKALIAKAKTANAADPTFLRDLTDLANGFDRPWKKLLFSDDFKDGNYTASPKWNVTRGQYFIEKGWGLRNKVEQAKTTQNNTNSDPLASVLGQILNQQSNNTQKTRSKNQPTAIHSNFRLTNAFSIDLEFSSWLNEGRIAIKAYQGQIQENVRASGYRLVYSPGARIELIRRTRSSSGVIETTASTYKLEDKKIHRILWTRSTDGTMIISIDGKQVIKTLDRSFRDPFNGVQLTSRGGDFIIKKVTVLGTP